MSTFANSEDPDEMQHDAAFHRGLHRKVRERSGSAVECLKRLRVREFEQYLRHCVVVLEQDTFILVLVQPRKTHPFLTERRNVKNQIKNRNTKGKKVFRQKITILPDTPRYVQWNIPKLLYQTRRKNPLVYKRFTQKWN